MPDPSRTKAIKKGIMIASGDEFFVLAIAMRNAQKRYFKDRIANNLSEAKRLEKKFDNYMVNIREQEVQGTLWKNQNNQ